MSEPAPAPESTPPRPITQEEDVECFILSMPHELLEVMVDAVKRLAVLMIAASLFAQPVSKPPDELITRWNRFAVHSNEYAALLNKGVKDVKLRARLVKDWESLTHCDCW